MSQNLPGRHYGRGFDVFLMLWYLLAAISFIDLVVHGTLYFLAEDANPWSAISLVSLAFWVVFFYTLPSFIACLSAHPSRSGVYFVNWLLGWTFLGWVIAMVWALSGYNARMEVIHAFDQELPPLKGGMRGIGIATILLGIFFICLDAMNTYDPAYAVDSLYRLFHR